MYLIYWRLNAADGVSCCCISYINQTFIDAQKKTPLISSMLMPETFFLPFCDIQSCSNSCKGKTHLFKYIYKQSDDIKKKTFFVQQ